MAWNPTHVVVAVQRAKDLKSKGKNGTNDAFVTIALGGKKFQTSIKDKVIDPEWYEECDIPLPDNYNEHKLTLQVFHRNNLGLDEFLGHLDIPLQNFDVYDPPRSIWYSLLCKPGQNKTKPRGEIEVRVAFEVKKVKDLDSMSTASATSTRFKMSKKSAKHAVNAIGRKLKGSKAEKTTDYIHVPDLTEMDSGALGMADIAENYAPVNISKKRLSTTSDSLSLPPSSPAFHRSSPHSSRGYSPFTKRRSKGENDTPPSSNASVEDVKQKADDADSVGGSFRKTHRRGGSGSDVGQPKVNRRLLTSKAKSSSTVDISASASSDFDLVGDRSSVASDDMLGKGRVRTATSTSQLSNDVLPEVNEDTAEAAPSDRKRLPSESVKPVEQPVLLDDESDDSMEDYKPSPIAPLVKKIEPTDIFARMDAQMKKEEENSFSLVKHEVSPGEDIFTPVGDLDKPTETVAHSTPLPADSPKAPAAASHAKKGKRKVTTPKSDLFNLLMASDEPEYAVDDTLPPNSRLVVPDEQEETKSGDRVGSFSDVQSANEEVKADELSADKNPFSEPPPSSQPVEASNPFEDEPATDDVVESSSKPRSSSNNPFDEFVESSAANSSSNPFEEVDEKAADVSLVSNNPFDEPAASASPSTNPFDEPATPNNPFDDDSKGGANPFEDEDEELAGSFNRVGSFTRKGSSRFAGSGRRKKREVKKAAAPPPPKPLRTYVESQAEEPVTVDRGDNSPKDSPRHKSKKDKKAPQAPALAGSPLVHARTGSTKSSSSSNNSRRNTDTSLVEPSASKTDEVQGEGKCERQPAVGAEAADIPDEPRQTRDVGVQVFLNSSLPAEFKHKSKQDLVDMILKLRMQVRKGEERAKDLDEYIESLLVKVMSADPNLLLNQTTCGQQATHVGKFT